MGDLPDSQIAKGLRFQEALVRIQRADTGRSAKLRETITIAGQHSRAQRGGASTARASRSATPMIFGQGQRSVLFVHCTQSRGARRHSWGQSPIDSHQPLCHSLRLRSAGGLNGSRRPKKHTQLSREPEWHSHGIPQKLVSEIGEHGMRQLRSRQIGLSIRHKYVQSMNMSRLISHFGMKPSRRKDLGSNT